MLHIWPNLTCKPFPPSPLRVIRVLVGLVHFRDAEEILVFRWRLSSSGLRDRRSEGKRFRQMRETNFKSLKLSLCDFEEKKLWEAKRLVGLYLSWRTKNTATDWTVPVVQNVFSTLAEKVQHSKLQTESLCSYKLKLCWNHGPSLLRVIKTFVKTHWSRASRLRWKFWKVEPDFQTAWNVPFISISHHFCQQVQERNPDTPTPSCGTPRR